MTSSQNRATQIIRIALQVALGVIFVYAAWTKLRDPWQLFAMNVDAYGLLPQWAVIFVARTLPWFELLLGVLLVTGFLLRLSSLSATLLLLFFFTLMVRAYVLDMEIDCGCFGPGDAISPRTLLRDGSLLAGAALLSILASLRSRKRTATA